jgi:uncharacterized protein with ParB-like and HNH nuclease domain
MEATPTQIINYFSGFKQYVVPLFQRPYTWGERQWKTLWEDVISFYDAASSDTKSTHFLGAVVSMPARSVPVGVNKFLVIDGQQRLTTIALLLCAIRDELGSSEAAPRRRIQQFYLTNDGFEGLDFFKLLPTQGDRPAFSSLISGSGRVQESQFRKAYDFFRRRLRDRDNNDKPIAPGRLLEIVESRLMVVMINLSDSDDPYLIFESLNFKGSPLEQADLVRNYFLMRFSVNEQQSVYDDLWLPMQNRLGPSLTEFMRHFLGSEGEEVRKGDVYAAIKRLVADSEAPAVRLLMMRMERLSQLYSRIATLAPEPNEDLSRYFVRFRRLDFGTAYPLLLSLYEDYSDGQFGISDFLESLRILDSYIVRRMVVGVPSNSLAGVFISLCKNRPVSETPEAWLSATLAREGKNRRWPTDAEFSDRWIKAPLYGSRACQVILECLEESSGHHETVSYAEASIEHVVPQTLTPEWEEVLGPSAANIQAEWLHTIGNLTVTGYNPELGNKSYAEKRVIFGLSHFELNRYFNAFATWGANEIRGRAETLLSVARHLWPRPAVLPEEQPAAENAQPANFNAECVKAVQRQLGMSFSKLSQTRYEAGEKGVRLVCAVSGEHNETSGSPYFWFAVHQKQLDFLSAAPASWLCFGCGSSAETLLIPCSHLTPFLPQMSVTKTQDRHYWHVVIQRKNSKLILRLLAGTDGSDLSSFIVAQQDLPLAAM